mmetsp:Transcript_60381/g.148161  ORF Transcript_60381/g.148161 Transcript_60381/m.148161 type:complete len:340 (-) Transcript_60381:215-1234(-)
MADSYPQRHHNIRKNTSAEATYSSPRLLAPLPQQPPRSMITTTAIATTRSDDSQSVMGTQCPMMSAVSSSSTRQQTTTAAATFFPSPNTRGRARTARRKMSPTSSSSSCSFNSSKSVLIMTMLFVIVQTLSPFNLFSVDAALVASIPAKDEECYYIRPPTGKTGILYGNYDHLDDDLSSDVVSVVVIDYEEEHVLYRSRRRASEGHFKVKLKADQKVALCLQNGLTTAGRGRVSKQDLHDGKDRTIGFSFYVDIKDEAQELKEQNTRLVDASQDLTRQLGNLINHHEYMRTREANHRELVEATFSHLLIWVIVEAFAVVIIAGGQIMYLRRFLEKRRYM